MTRLRRFGDREKSACLIKADALIQHGFTRFGAAKAALDYYGPFAGTVGTPWAETLNKMAKDLSGESGD